MGVVASWTSALCRELGLDRDGLDRSVVSRVARDVQRDVARPAAPVTVFLLGIAIGRGLPAGEAVARLEELLRYWRGIDWRD